MVLVFITHSESIAPASISVLVSFFFVIVRNESFSIVKAVIVNGIKTKEIKVRRQS